MGNRIEDWGDYLAARKPNCRCTLAPVLDPAPGGSRHPQKETPMPGTNQPVDVESRIRENDGRPPVPIADNDAPVYASDGTLLDVNTLAETSDDTFDRYLDTCSGASIGSLILDAAESEKEFAKRADGAARVQRRARNYLSRLSTVGLPENVALSKDPGRG